MTGSDTPRRSPRPGWFGPVVAVALVAMAAISLAIYLGLVARGPAWPLFVLAVGSAPLVTLAVAQGVRAVVGRGSKGGNSADAEIK